MKLQHQNQYLTTQVQTASAGELTLMLYNGCIKFIKLGMTFLEQGNITEKHYNLTRAINIIEELQSTLNMDYELSKSLLSLYEYMNHLLTTANMKNDITSLNECLEMVIDLRDTWGVAIKEAKRNGKVM